MDATTNAARQILDQTRSETLQELLAYCQPTNVSQATNVPALDSILCSQTTPGSSSQTANVIEIQGAAGTGKSHLVYYLLINCVLPYKIEGAILKGWEKAAILLDMDNTFDVRRFRQLLVSRLTRSAGHEAVLSIVNQCLTRLHVFQPSSSLRLAATIIDLPRYHASRIREDSIGLVAIDSMSAFYWPDRYTSECLRSFKGPSQNLPSNPLYAVMHALSHLRRAIGCTVILTNWGLLPSATGPFPSMQFYRQHLPPPYPSPFSDGREFRETAPSSDVLSLTHHITLFSEPVPSRLSESEQDGSRERSQSQYAQDQVKDVKVHGLVRTPGTPVVQDFQFHVRAADVGPD